MISGSTLTGLKINEVGLFFAENPRSPTMLKSYLKDPPFFQILITSTMSKFGIYLKGKKWKKKG
jgi:hypothetical protein